MQESDNCLFLLVDRASQRHKFDNKLKESPVLYKRIRADIADLCLEFMPILHLYKRIVSLGKHLCGSATGEAKICGYTIRNSKLIVMVKATNLMTNSRNLQHLRNISVQTLPIFFWNLFQSYACTRGLCALGKLLVDLPR
jgi:hypothetical protein